MISDKLLIEHFLDALNGNMGTTYSLQETPDEIERNEPAIDAIAISAGDKLLAIEHTLVMPFEGEKADTHIFTQAIAPLEMDESLKLPNHIVTLSVPVGAIPRREDLHRLGGRIGDWYRDRMDELPTGESLLDIPDLGFEFRVAINKESYPESEGELCVSRLLPPDSYVDVVRRAFSKKLDKLVAATANARYLLVEKDVPLPSFRKLQTVIEEIQTEFPQLEEINEVWIADTVSWESRKLIGFGLVRPIPEERVWFWHNSKEN